MSSNSNAAGVGFGSEWDDVRSGRQFEASFTGPVSEEDVRTSAPVDVVEPSEEDVRAAIEQAEKDGRWADSLALKSGDKAALAALRPNATTTDDGTGQGDGTTDTTNEEGTDGE